MVIATESPCDFRGHCLGRQRLELGADIVIPGERYRACSAISGPWLLSRRTTTNVVAVEIRPSAHKHAVSDDNIRHAIDNAIAAITRPEQPDFTMLIGPDTSAHLLEIGIIETEAGLRDPRDGRPAQIPDHDQPSKR